MLENKKIAFIGAGSMAEAMIAGFISNEMIPQDQVIATNKSNKERRKQLEEQYGIKTTASPEEAVATADIIILAMKPNHVEQSACEIREQVRKGQLIISVLAGTSTQYIESLFEKQVAVIRAMPNTSAKVNASATVISKGTYATADDIQIASFLFSAIGTVTVLDEKYMDVVTGISGSGPAYFYYFAEAMAEAAEKEGLEKEDAVELIYQTILGVGLRLKQSEKTPKELYEEVMSPGGTTEAAFQVFIEKGVKETFKQAIKAAIHRSREFGKEERVQKSAVER